MLAWAVEAMQHVGIHVEEISPIYETASWGVQDLPAYLNQVIQIECSWSPNDLLQILKGIESGLGRQSRGEWMSREIDLDIIAYDDKIIEEEVLQIPHKWMHQRTFVLVPLADIAPAWKHPIYQKTVAELLRDCKDETDIKRQV